MADPAATDPIALLQDLIRCPSVTPAEGGAITLLEKLLEKNGFSCHRLTFSEPGYDDVENLYARHGTESPHLCFAGHTDVVPVGEQKDWTFDPFSGEIRDGYVCGRGAADMKGPIACFAAAAIGFLKSGKPRGSISFLITGDEEGPSVNGTKKVLQWLEKKGEKIDFCLVGEPTSREKLGDMIKIGRRGSLNGRLVVKGLQGHVAYPHLADNPVSKLVTLLKALDDLELDRGTEHFQPSNLEIVNIDVRNKAENVIPGEAQASFNVRFNDTWTGAALEKKLRETLDTQNIKYDLHVRISGESFYTAPGPQSGMVAKAIKAVTGREPELSTTGGTSDARFIRNYCPVLEFGIVGTTMHKNDERVALPDMTALTEIYSQILKSWFNSP